MSISADARVWANIVLGTLSKGITIHKAKKQPDTQYLWRIIYETDPAYQVLRVSRENKAMVHGTDKLGLIISSMYMEVILLVGIFL